MKSQVKNLVSQAFAVMFFVYFLVVMVTNGSIDIVLPSLRTCIKGTKVLPISTCNSGLFLHGVKYPIVMRKVTLTDWWYICVQKHLQVPSSKLSVVLSLLIAAYLSV